MKVTALIPDKIVNEVKKYSGGKNITESLVIALDEWVSLKKIKDLNKKIQDTPLVFISDFDAKKIRSLNRK
jgi:hypothetical protein